MILQEAVEQTTEAAPQAVEAAAPAVDETAHYAADTLSHAVESADHAAEGPFNLSEMLMGKVLDTSYIDLFGYHLELPHWDPIQVGPLAIDLSPSKYAVFMALGGLVCLIIFLAAGLAARKTDATKAPSGIANAVEGLVLFFRDSIVRANIGHGSDGYTPFILTLFVFIAVMNLMGLVPYGYTAASSLSVTAALAFICLIVIEISGMRALGPAGYAHTIFYSPPGMPPFGKAIMLLVMTPIELLGKLAKPFALAVRLFANMAGGKFLILALLGLIFVFAENEGVRWGVAGGAVAMASAITVLKVFIAVLQAYIFAMLTAVFIGLIKHAH